MKQLLQSLKTGEIAVVDVPVPTPSPNEVLVRNEVSAVSAGTERMVATFAEKNLVGKAWSRPDLAREALHKARREGVVATVQAARARLDQPMAMGYSCAGTVAQVGDRVQGIRPGDRVACAGAGYAVHAEMVSVPKNLVVQVPAGVDAESAAFAALGATALHGVRLSGATVGEAVAVLGLGVVGQLTVQLLRAAGCVVAAMDPEPDRVALAVELGAQSGASTAQELVEICRTMTASRGMDAVIIAADTKSNEPVEAASRVSRDRGTVVAVGAVGLEVPRKAFYEKELQLRVSRSYGPGRYDAEYEEKGHDYPVGYVRWTEGRNMTAFLDLVADAKIGVTRLITHRFPIDRGPEAYELVTKSRPESYLGVVITYAPPISTEVRAGRIPIEVRPALRPPLAVSNVGLGLLGAGNFALNTLLPAVQKVKGIELVGVCSARGSSAKQAAERFGFRYSCTDVHQILRDPHVDVVAVATQHHLHADQTIEALAAGKHVFCEKPLCLNEDELTSVLSQYARDPSRVLTVGYNRRFAPIVRELRTFVAGATEPMMISYRVNAGYLPTEHWLHDPERGGGRILGEVCHFIDLLIFITGSEPVEVHTAGLPDVGRYRDDNVVVVVRFSDGSIGHITYVANGDRSLSKERIEVFSGGRTAVLEDFRRLRTTAGGRSRSVSTRLHDKGHRREWEELVGALRRGDPPPIPIKEIVAGTLATFAAAESLRCSSSIPVDADALRDTPKPATITSIEGAMSQE